MFVLLKKVTISIVLLCYLFTNQAVGETTDEKPKSHINYLDTISAEFRQSTHPPDLGYIKQLYEKELKNRPDSFTYFRYAVIVRYTAQNAEELKHALEIEKEAAMRCLHFLGNSFYAMSLMANIISVSYRENKHIPLDEKGLTIGQWSLNPLKNPRSTVARTEANPNVGVLRKLRKRSIKE